MKKNFTELFFLLSLLVPSICGAYTEIGPPPYRIEDENNVNLITGRRSIHKTDLFIGSGESKLEHTVLSYGDLFYGFYDNFTGIIVSDYSSATGLTWMVSFNGMSTQFSKNGEAFSDRSVSGATLEEVASGEYVYTHGDGVKVYFYKDIIPSMARFPEVTPTITGKVEAAANRAVYPNGVEIKIHFKARKLYGYAYNRIQSVTTNLGMQFKYKYTNNSSADAPSFSEIINWQQPYEIVAINNSVEYCSQTVDECILTNTWPSVKYTWPEDLFGFGGDFSISMPEGETVTYTHTLYCDMGDSCEVKRPRISKIVETTSSEVYTSIYEYKSTYHCTNSGVSWDCSMVRPLIVYKSSRGGAQWIYNYSIPPYEYVPSQNDSVGPTSAISLLIVSATGEPYRITDTKKQAVFKLSHGYRVDSVAYDFGNSFYFTYDSISNVTERREVAKEGSGLPDMVQTAGYENNCASKMKTQHKASWMRDEKNNQTDYTYHCESGNIATITQPTSGNGIRPQKRYTYVQKYARYKNSAGQIVQASSPVWMLSTESYCQKGAATGTGCALVNDEVVTTYEYGSGTDANNLFLKGIVVTAASATQRTCYGYDNYGNRISETLPKAELFSCP